MIEHCISSLRTWQHDLLYKVYVTDFLRSIRGNNNTPRFYDLMFPNKTPQDKQETAESVIERITKNLREI